MRDKKKGNESHINNKCVSAEITLIRLDKNCRTPEDKKGKEKKFHGIKVPILRNNISTETGRASERQARTKTHNESQSAGSGISEVQSSVSYTSIEMQIKLSQHNRACQDSLCVYVCAIVGEDVHLEMILTHLPTCFSNGVKMSLFCAGLQTWPE